MRLTDSQFSVQCATSDTLGSNDGSKVLPVSEKEKRIWNLILDN